MLIGCAEVSDEVEEDVDVLEEREDRDGEA